MSYSKIAAQGLEPAKIRFYYPITELFNSLNLRTTMRAVNIKDASGKVMLDEASISLNELAIFKEFMEAAIFDLGATLFKLTEGVNNSIFHDSKITFAGSIATISLGTGGTGYATGDIIEIVQDGGLSGCARVATVSNGAVATFDAIVGSTGMGGSGYTVANGLPTTAFTGSGTGCTVDILTVVTVNILTENSSGFEIVDNQAYNANVVPTIDKKIKACIRESIMMEWYGDIMGIEGDYKIHRDKFNERNSDISKLTHQLRLPSMT